MSYVESDSEMSRVNTSAWMNEWNFQPACILYVGQTFHYPPAIVFNVLVVLVNRCAYLFLEKRCTIPVSYCRPQTSVYFIEISFFLFVKYISRKECAKI